MARQTNRALRAATRSRLRVRTREGERRKQEHVRARRKAAERNLEGEPLSVEGPGLRATAVEASEPALPGAELGLRSGLR